MGFLFGLMGAVLGMLLGAAAGGMVGGGFGALIGVPVGGTLGTLLGLRTLRGTRRAGVLRRLEALEAEVGLLREEVGRLRTGGTAPTAVEAPPAAEAFEAARVAPAIVAPPAAAVPIAADRAVAATADAGPGATPEVIAKAIPEAAPTWADASPAVEAPSPPAVSPAPPVPPALPLRDRLPPFLSRWIFGGNTIVKVGVLILFLGLAFLLRYAAERVSVPVEWRYAGVGAVGVFLLGLGWRLRWRPDAAGGSGYGLILQGAGIGVFYLTVLAAIKLNALLPAPAAFGVMAAVAVFGAVLAVMQDAPWLALVAMAEGFAAPVLVSTGGSHHVALFSYLAILDLGIVLMAWHKAWRPLNLVGATATAALAGAWAQGHYSAAIYPSTQAFLLLFFVLFTAIGVLFARRALALGGEPGPGLALSARALDALRRVGRVDSTLAFGVPLAAFGLQYGMVRDDPWGPAMAAFGFGLFYLLLGGALLRRAAPRYALLGEAYVIVSVIFGTLTIPLALEGGWTGATWAVEAAGMYWLGARQHRPYARAFALLVMAAALLRLGSSLALDQRPGVPLVRGSVLGMLLAIGGLAAMLRVYALGDAAQRPAWEHRAARLLPAVTLASLLTLAWMLSAPLWASVASAWMAFGALALPLGRPRRAWQFSGCAGYAVALAGLASTLHADDGQQRLAGGWPGLAAALLIGLSLLGAAMRGGRAPWRAAAANDRPPAWPRMQDAAWLIGLAVMCGALLYAMPASDAARVWPWIGLGLLALGLRTAHPALALAWFVLQVGSAIVGLFTGPPIWSLDGGASAWVTGTLALTGVWAGDWLQRQAAPDGRRRTRWPSPWAATPAAQWGIVLWVLAWWSQLLPPEALRRLASADRLADWPALLVGWVAATSLLMVAAMRWRAWLAMGRATAATVPAWIAVALLVGPGATGQAPSANAGWLAWPIALLWHGLLLREQRGWLRAPVQQGLHGLGFWLFVLLAAREAELALDGLGAPGSAWPTLGLMLVPALVLGLLTRPAVQRRWPVREQPGAYLLAGCGPLALYLLLWLWTGNLTAGEAAPLPSLPLLNPLDIGQGLVLLALLQWWRDLPPALARRLPSAAVAGVLGATAFALVTGMVLRACHHLAGVPWQAEALYASTLTQAALSVAWSAIAVGLMLLGHRRARRSVWGLGAGLLAVVVAKLFLIELADHGGLYRIVSFIVVGALLLVVGYFAPVPPRQAGPAALEGSA